jgi:hypothetical protein
VRLETTAHEDGDLSVRLKPEHIDALLSGFRWMAVEEQARLQREGRYMASFDVTKLDDVNSALLRDGREATPEEQGIDWRSGKKIDLS